MPKLTWTLNKNDALTVRWALSIVIGLDGYHNRAEFAHALDLHKTLTTLLEADLIDK